MALALGAAGVWVGTRFVCATEAGASPSHQQEIISADFSDTIRTLFYTGRPLRVKKKNVVLLWEGERRADMQANLDKGKIPFQVYEEELRAAGKEDEETELSHTRRLLMGQNAGAITSIKPAREIVESMVREAVAQIRLMGDLIRPHAKL
jgi:NAD(P)H-dependent flavin oxidoreductase YrpB (nitropropane dioxygenase family)